MENKTFTEMMEEILQNCEDYTTTTIPNFLKQVFDKIISERKREIKLEPNDFSAEISLDCDATENKYVRYLDEQGNVLLIFQDGIDYIDYPFGIKVSTTTIENEVKKLYDEIREKRYLEYMEDGLDKFKAGDKEEGNRKISKTSEGYKETEDKTGKEILDRILYYYKEELDKNKKTHDIQCYIAEEERGEIPRGEKHPRKPKEHKAEYDTRFQEIEKIIGASYATINEDKYVSYFYDLQKNGKGEAGYILLIEPRDIDGAGISTRIGYLSTEEYNKIKDKLQNRKQRTDAAEKRINVTDEDIKDEFIKLILGDLERKEKTVTVRHKEGDFEGFIKRIKYYITGDRSLGRDYIYKLRAKLMGEER